ncbi:PadR family transcriptional regulator [Janthinobacterium fluminis]|uniref:PadR family transcriptional regulator n=1 Tax=Janthinobacterium fluminis TaxID=2987524 RepID=A0ABT5K1X9_9BURK|nr:PadR family transcriptional regulator [Janthinobacterium fluminis]MDC8758986.1 PadR family transcriptional regulator [Janthinobacterium fluminis]
MFHFFRGQHRVHAHQHGQPHCGGRGPKMFDAGSMRYVVLQLIAERPRHGYEIIKEIEQRAGGSYAPSPGAIYPLLSMLLDLGHVSAETEGNKKLHSITPEGQAFLDENRQFVDAILARMAAPQEGRDDVRHLLHELKGVVVARVRNGQPSEARLAAVCAILRRAAAEIAQLD